MLLHKEFKNETEIEKIEKHQMAKRNWLYMANRNGLTSHLSFWSYIEKFEKQKWKN